MHVTRFEPWSIADLVHGDIKRFATRRFAQPDVDQRVADWVPTVDIVEEKERFVLRADVPGVDPKDIDVSMDARVLTVAGKRHAEDVSEEDGLRRAERSSGRFYRRFTLPETADSDSITAKTRNGILEVVIPKQAEVQARRIDVEAA